MERSRSGPQDESSYVVNEATHFSIEIAVTNREGGALTADDLARKFEGADWLNEDVEAYLGTHLRQVARLFQTGTRPRNIRELSSPLIFAGRAEHVETGLKTRISTSIHGVSLRVKRIL
jgi:hypothetical protein